MQGFLVEGLGTWHLGFGKYILSVDMLKGLRNVAFRVWEVYSNCRHAERA